LLVRVCSHGESDRTFVCGLLSSIISLVVLAALAVHARLNQASRK